MSLYFFFSNNEGWIFWPSPTLVSSHSLVCVDVCLLFSAQHTIQHHWKLTMGLYGQDCLFIWVGCGGFVTSFTFHNNHQLQPKSKNLQKEAFSHKLSAFPRSCRSTPGVLVPEQQVQPALLRLYGKLNVFSMHLGESWNCIQSSGRDRWGSQEGCSPHMSKISGCSNTLWLK